MTPETLDILARLVEALKRQVSVGECPVMVALDGVRPLTMSDYDYQRDDVAAASFEQRAAAKARETGATRWVIAVPQVWLVAGKVVATRAVSNLPLRPGESEAITWMSFDNAEGVDYGRVPFTRGPSGKAVFGDIEIVIAQASPTPSMPGYTMLRLTAGDETTSEGTEPGSPR
jgi:hypothetical protein